MIRIKEVEITSDNIGDILEKSNVYGIVPSVFGERYELTPFGDCQIKNVLMGEILIIEIVKD